jgi:hypothetical protein
MVNIKPRSIRNPLAVNKVLGSRFKYSVAAVRDSEGFHSSCDLWLQLGCHMCIFTFMACQRVSMHDNKLLTLTRSVTPDSLTAFELPRLQSFRRSVSSEKAFMPFYFSSSIFRLVLLWARNSHSLVSCYSMSHINLPRRADGSQCPLLGLGH